MLRWGQTAACSLGRHAPSLLSEIEPELLPTRDVISWTVGPGEPQTQRLLTSPLRPPEPQSSLGSQAPVFRSCWALLPPDVTGCPHTWVTSRCIMPVSG